MPKPKTTKGKDTLLNAVAAATKNYSQATTKLFNTLLADNEGETVAALGGLWIIRHNIEHDIMRQLRAYAKSAAERKERR